MARVFGDYPNYPETAYFLQTNCELSNNSPETCNESNPLIWNRDGAAVKVYKVNGTNDGINTFSLIDWKTGNGGVWENWYVDEMSTLVEESGAEIDCSVVSSLKDVDILTKVYPNPFVDCFIIESQEEVLSFSLFDQNGQTVLTRTAINAHSLSIDKSFLLSGVYFLEVESSIGLSHFKLLKD